MQRISTTCLPCQARRAAKGPVAIRLVFKELAKWLPNHNGETQPTFNGRKAGNDEWSAHRKKS